MILQNHRRLPVITFIVKIAALGPLKRVTGYWLKISKLQAQTLSFIFYSTKQQDLKKLSVHVQKVSIYYYKPSKKYSSRDTILLTYMWRVAEP